MNRWTALKARAASLREEADHAEADADRCYQESPEYASAMEHSAERKKCEPALTSAVEALKEWVNDCENRVVELYIGYKVDERFDAFSKSMERLNDLVESIEEVSTWLQRNGDCVMDSEWEECRKSVILLPEALKVTEDALRGAQQAVHKDFERQISLMVGPKLAIHDAAGMLRSLNEDPTERIPGDDGSKHPETDSEGSG